MMTFLAGSLRTVILITLLLVCVAQARSKCDKGQFKPDFQRRCGNLNREYRYNKDCGKLWRRFREGFCNKKDKDMQKSNYNAYVSAATHSLRRNQVTFYSGLRECGIKKNYMSISRTMLGGPVNGTCWTSDPNHKYGYVIQETCGSRTERTFWGRVSREYASLAEGEVRILLDGLNRHAFLNGTIFAEDELPNLNRDAVTKVTVYVVGTNQVQPRENCGTGSLSTLESLITNKYKLRGYSCIQDLEKTREVYCRQQRIFGCRTSSGDCWVRVPRMMTVGTAPELSAGTAVLLIIISAITEIILL